MDEVVAVSVTISRSDIMTEVMYGIVSLLGAIALVAVGMVVAKALSERQDNWSGAWPVGLLLLIAGFILLFHGVDHLQHAKIYQYIISTRNGPH